LFVKRGGRGTRKKGGATDKKTNWGTQKRGGKTGNTVPRCPANRNHEDRKDGKGNDDSVKTHPSGNELSRLTNLTTKTPSCPREHVEYPHSPGKKNGDRVGEKACQKRVK